MTTITAGLAGGFAGSEIGSYIGGMGGETGAMIGGFFGGLAGGAGAASAASKVWKVLNTPDRIVIGKVKDLENLGQNERSLLDRLPNQGSAKANWRQNSGVLREEIRQGGPIRDASLNPDGTLKKYPGSFLEAERNLLRNQGWTFDPSTGLWNPPK